MDVFMFKTIKPSTADLEAVSGSRLRISAIIPVSLGNIVFVTSHDPLKKAIDPLTVGMSDSSGRSKRSSADTCIFAALGATVSHHGPRDALKSSWT